MDEKKYDFKNSSMCTEFDFDEMHNILEKERNEEEKLLLEVQRIETEFANNLIKLRKSKGLTQSDIAKKTGLTQQAVSTLEKCDRKPTLPNLIRYLLGLDIDINQLLKNLI